MTSAVSLVGLAGCRAFRVVPAHVAGRSGLPPSEKLNIAGVGVGAMGTVNIDRLSHHNIVALCDVDSRCAANAFRAHPKARKYRDFRKMLERQTDIDAIVVATPDHWHALVAETAVRMGKHVYCEKPLTHTVSEARRLGKVARDAGVATQMGNAGQASEQTRLTCEWIWDGAIGQVRKVHVWVDRPLGKWGWPQGIERPQSRPPVPSTLDWDMWVGPAPHRPYHPCYLPHTWRGWYDFGTGALGDMGCHEFHPIFKALKLGHPTRVSASSTTVFEETFPLASIVTYEFPAREDMVPVTLIWYDGGLKPPRPHELEAGLELGDRGVLYVGDKGKMLDGNLIPESRMVEYEPPPKTLPRSIGHYEEWIEACKGGPPAGSNFEYAGFVTEVVLLGNVAVRTGRMLEWDGPDMKITNVPEANELIHTHYRKRWQTWVEQNLGRSEPVGV